MANENKELDALTGRINEIGIRLRAIGKQLRNLSAEEAALRNELMAIK